MLWATHLIDEVDLKGNLIILHKGKIMVNDSVKNVLQKSNSNNVSNAFDSFVKN